MKSLRLIGLCAAFAVATAACGGGGSGSSGNGPLPPTPPPGPPVTYGNQYTSYTVYQANVNGESVIDVSPIGVVSALPAAKVVAGTVIYPDSSVQVADAAGNFDASQSSWTFSNLSALTANPANQPLVDVAYFPLSGLAPIPEEISISAYAPSVNLVPLAEGANATSVPELATVSMQPKSAWLEDGHNRVFTIYGRDTSGAPFSLAKAQVTWKIVSPVGCAASTAKILPLPSDASKAIYSAPASGSLVGTCSDQVVASVAANGATYTGSGSAYFFDAKSAKLGGVLTDATGKAVANALIDLYAQSADASQGTLLVNTDATGKFARTVPSNRVMTPVVLSIANKKASGNVITPASIDPRVVSAGALASQAWKLGAAATVTKPPATDYAAIIRDASFYSAVMRTQLPLDTPNAGGTFQAGTIEAVLASPAPRATGTVASGDYRKYTYAWDATGNVATFTQPGTASEAEVLVVTLKAATVGGKACATGANCYSFTQKHGANFLNDGAWSQQVASGKYNVTYVANQYSSTHQTPGSPLYVNTTTLSSSLGSNAAAALTQTRATPAGLVLAQVSTTHSPGTAPAVYTYTGNVKDFPSGKTSLEIDYTLNSGVTKEDGSGSFQFLDAHSPELQDVGVSILWNLNAPALAVSSGNRVVGTIDVPGQKNLASGHSASFTIDVKNVVHLTLDASLGGSVSTFQL